MKKIFFGFGIMLALLQPIFSYAVKAMPAHSFEIVQGESQFLPHYLQIENLYFGDYIFDLDDDDIKDSETNKLSFGKTAFTFISSPANNFSEHFFKCRWSSRHLFLLPSSHFISLKVFRL